MRMSRLALMNFRNSFRHYLSLVLSLAFTVLVFLNFQNILDSDAYEILGSRNQDYVEMLIKVVAFVLGCFTFFFVWYATNVFLTRRKKEIGIYIFMGLNNQQIGTMYAIETSLIGLAALLLGVVSGELLAGLFQMLLGWLSDVAVEISFRFSIKPVVVTAMVYFVIYFLFVLKGYVNIIRSSVSDMLSAAKQNEFVQQKNLILLLKTVLGVSVLGTGFYLAVREDSDILSNGFAAVVLVVTGVYLLFGGLIPLIFQSMAHSKRFLYYGERSLWVNNMVFRIRKNYRTYAMVSVLSLCAVTALACGFGMKQRYDNMERFRHTYTFQLMSNQAGLGEQAEAILRNYTEISGQSEIPILQVTDGVENYPYNKDVMVMDYSRLQQVAENMNLEFDIPQPADDEIMEANHVPLMSFLTGQRPPVTIFGKEYRNIAETNEPFVGYVQEIANMYIVNASEYQRLLPMGRELYTYNYQIADLDCFAQARDALGALVVNTEDIYTARVAIDPHDTELAWVRVLYSLCIFMFLVFIVASGCILFVKQYNDAFEERERCQVLYKLGVEGRLLRRAVAKELGSAYLMSFLVMAAASGFSVYSLGKVMKTNLAFINVVSVLAVLLIFLVFYGLSVMAYLRNAEVE